MEEGLEEMELHKKEILDKIPDGKTKYLVPSVEEWQGNHKLAVHKPEDIFPLKRATFGDFEFNVPAQTHKYIQRYIPNYMQFPHVAINTHGKEGAETISISQIAKHYGIDMTNIYNQLMNIYIYI